MSSDYQMVTMIPPASNPPALLQLDGKNYLPNSDGTFTVPSRVGGYDTIGALLGAGWAFSVTSGTTHVP
jgi:hypothetical protein